MQGANEAAFENEVVFRVNGNPVRCPQPSGRLLVEFLRQELRLTGTKEACGIGVCGLCTVLVDGAALSACLLPVNTLGGADVWTIEGITAQAAGGPGPPSGPRAPELLAEVQRAFVEAEGLQCGICTPGQVMAAYTLLLEHPQPDASLTRRYMAGNLCRCTGYHSILRSVRLAAERWAARRAAL